MTIWEAVRYCTLRCIDVILHVYDSINLGGFTLFHLTLVFIIIGIIISVFVRSGKA